MGHRISWMPLLALVFLLVPYGCQQVDDSQVAGATAKCYYEYLLAGEYDHFVDGLFQERKDSGYRAELIANAKMFMKTIETRRCVISSVDVDTAMVDDELSTAEVYLFFHYSDSTIETVLVPMQKIDGLWLMR